MIQSISKTLDKHQVNQVLPDTLYHYTSGGGLDGILSSKELWMTNSKFLNDAQEENEIQTLAHQAIVDLTYKCHDNNMKLSENDIQFLELLKAPLNWSYRGNYIGSFTELDDSLSQWRAYCPKAGGFALGIKANHLSNVVTEQRFYLIKCIYDRQIALKVINEILFYYLKKYDEIEKTHGEEKAMKDYAKEVSSQFSQELRNVSPIFKHTSFAEEREWRIISPTIIARFNESIGFRETERGVIPYYKLRLTTDKYPCMGYISELSKDLDINEYPYKDYPNLRVVCGPAVSFVNSSTVAQLILEKHGYNAQCSLSQVPYKTW